MQCLYCDRHLGFFHSAKGAFCSEQHEELYRNAAQSRLEAPYAPTSGALANSAEQADREASGAKDLAQLLQATQADSGARVETPAEVAMAANSAEVGTLVTSSVAGTNDRALSGFAATNVGATGIRTDEARERSDSNAPSRPDLSPGAGPAASGEEPDRRSEPRVKAVKMVKVAGLREPEREMSCALVDISDTGIQFTADTDFRVGEILIAEIPEQLVLTEVRHSQANGDRYAIGAERVQSVSKDDVPATSNGMARAEALINALCDRVRTGFADEAAQGADAAASDHRGRALERVAKILEIWQSTKSDPKRQAKTGASSIEPAEKLDGAAAGASIDETQAERRLSSGAGRAFAAVAAGLVIVGLLMVCLIQFRKSGAVGSPPAAPKVVTTAHAGGKPTPEVKQQPAMAPSVQAQATVEAKQVQPVQQHAAAAPKAEPAPQVKEHAAAKKAAPAPLMATAGPGPHRAQIKALATTWVGASADGHKLFGAMIAQGSTKELEYSKFAFVHAGNAAGVEITVDGQPVPMGNQPRLRLVELTTTGFQFLRWSNDDPARP